MKPSPFSIAAATVLIFAGAATVLQSQTAPAAPPTPPVPPPSIPPAPVPSVAGAATVLQSQTPPGAPSAPPVPAPAPAPDAAAKELAALRAEVETLKAKACDQSHVMQDVAYHFTNLWFAG